MEQKRQWAKQKDAFLPELPRERSIRDVDKPPPPPNVPVTQLSASVRASLLVSLGGVDRSTSVPSVASVVASVAVLSDKVSKSN